MPMSPVSLDMRRNIANLQASMREQGIVSARLVISETGEPVAINLATTPGWCDRQCIVELYMPGGQHGVLPMPVPFEDGAAGVLVAMLHFHPEARMLVLHGVAHLVLPARGPVTVVDAGQARDRMLQWYPRIIN